MVPEAMKSLPFHTRRHSPADRPRTTRFGHAILERSSNPRLPACSRDCHCASRSCVEADLVAPVARNAELDRGPTSRLHHEAVFAASVSRNDAGDLTARGARTLASMFGPVSQTDHRRRRTVLLQPGLRSARFPERIVDREEVSCAADFAAPTRFPERSSATRRTGRPYSASNTSSFQLPGSTVCALRHGLLELVMPAIFRPVSRASITSRTARGPSMTTSSSPDFPGAHAAVAARLPMLWRHPLRVVAHGECFLGTQSPACRAGSRCDHPFARLPVRENVANGDLVFSTRSPARSDHRAL